jgi:hypothetical protein
MTGWRTTWSMVGRWLVYVPAPQEAIDRGHSEQQISLPAEFKAEAHILGAAHDLMMLAHQYRNDLLYPPSHDSRKRRLKAIDAVFDKIEGVR